MHNTSDISAILKRYQPIIYLHPDESYFPCTIDFYIENSQLIDPQKKNKVLVDFHKLTQKKMVNEQNEIKYPLNLDIDSNYIYGELKYTNDIPFYASFQETPDEWIIQYIFFYAYNGPFTVCCFEFGEHESDVEHITMHVSRHTHQITKLFLAAHGYHDGQWIDLNKIKFQDKHPILYSALHSHATYGKEGTFYRICCCANDHTKESIHKWSPHNIILIDESTEWNQYKGYLGIDNHVSTPLHQEWWKNESKKSTNWFKRLFCCCC